METGYELISQYGYAAIFLLITLGFLGLPVPGAILLTFIGFLISTGKMHVVLAFSAALSGVLSGISISYWVGWKWGDSFLYKIGPKLFIQKKTINRTEYLFRKYASLVLVLSYFIPGIKKVVAYLAGVSDFSFKRFALFAYSGALLWVSVFLALGHVLGAHWKKIISYVQDYTWLGAILIGIVAAICGIYVVHRHRNLDKRLIDYDERVKDKDS